MYLKGFYEGVMLVGPCAGEKVCDAKAKIRQELIGHGDALPYYEPESLVTSRQAMKSFEFCRSDFPRFMLGIDVVRSC